MEERPAWITRVFLTWHKEKSCRYWTRRGDRSAWDPRHRAWRLAGLSLHAGLYVECCAQTAVCQLRGFECFHLGCFASRWRQSKAPLKYKVAVNMHHWNSARKTQSVGSGTTKEEGESCWRPSVKFYDLCASLAHLKMWAAISPDEAYCAGRWGNGLR